MRELTTRCITREHRTAYILLLDISTSMIDIIHNGSERLTKIESLVKIANTIVLELLHRVQRNEGMRDYYDVAIMCYSGDGVSTIFGDLENPFTPITKLYLEGCSEENRESWLTMQSLTYMDLVDDPTVLELQNKLLFEPYGESPMYEALYMAYEATKDWCKRPENRDSVPPTVIHLTDGHPTDCDLSMIKNIADKVKGVKTNIANVLLINILIGEDFGAHTLLFPTDRELRKESNPFVKTLASASSLMPAIYNQFIEETREQAERPKFQYRKDELYRGFGYNVSVFEAVDIISVDTQGVPFIQ